MLAERIWKVQKGANKYAYDTDSENNTYRQAKECFKSNESSWVSNDKYMLKFPVADKFYQSNNIGTQSDAKSSSRIKADWTYVLPSINDNYYEEDN